MKFNTNIIIRYGGGNVHYNSINLISKTHTSLELAFVIILKIDLIISLIKNFTPSVIYSIIIQMCVELIIINKLLVIMKYSTYQVP